MDTIKNPNQPCVKIPIGRNIFPHPMNTEKTIYQRFIRERLANSMSNSPAIFLYGPRQCGKTTLARAMEHNSGHQYINFDISNQRSSVLEDPEGFMAQLPERVILDEVQRVPELFSLIKNEIDRKRTPNRFFLTGSSNMLHVRRISDSLAGRVEFVRLHPLAQSEISLQQPPAFLDMLLSGDMSRGYVNQAEQILSHKDLFGRVVSGGYPPSVACESDQKRLAWGRNYCRAQYLKDIRDALVLRHSAAADNLPQLLKYAASLTASLLNMSTVAKKFGIDRKTAASHIKLLERMLLLKLLPPWRNNEYGRQVATPKLHFGDTGLASALLGKKPDQLKNDPHLAGRFLETFVFQEIRRMASWHEEPLRFSHFRTKDKVKVDLVIEKEDELAGVEVKSGATIWAEDFRGLKKLAQIAGDRFICGIVFYRGENILPFGRKPRLYAVPFSRLWK